MDSVVNLNNQESSNEIINAQAEERGWKKVEQKKKKIPKTILGEATDEGSNIKAVPRLAYLHVYRL